jgi:glycosyltransferase involved in cell wall biosynthesis
MNKQLLMVAWGISPRWGSEDAVGWNWLKNIPPGWSTTLLTSRRGAEEVLWGQQNNQLAPSLKSLEMPDGAWKLKSRKMGFLLRMELWRSYSYDLKLFKDHAKRLVQSTGIDLIHQTTVATWRCGMPFYSLKIPTVWGPIGGSEPFPWRYLAQTSMLNWLYEGGRSLSGFLAQNHRSVVESVREVDVIIATNRQTEDLLRSLGRVKPVLRQPMVISSERFQKIRQSAQPKRQNLLKIISGGTIEGRKGFALTIRALSELKKQGIPFEFTITGSGFESEKLKALARECGIHNEVLFEPALCSAEYIKRLSESHIFCFPSLRDNSPVTLIEAMASGCVPIVLNNGGPAEAVNSDCGFVLPLESPDNTIKRICDVMSLLWEHEDLRVGLSSNAVEQVAQRYLENRISQVLAEAYSLALEFKNSVPSLNEEI